MYMLTTEQVMQRNLGMRRRRQKWDLRSVIARRIKALNLEFCEALSPPLTALQATKIRRAAELLAAAEALRAKYLKGDKIDEISLVRVENAADRAMRSLGITKRKRTGQPATLSSLLDLPTPKAGS
jgi:hypothetical protein